MSICAVIPAAGRGSRLGLAGPKILAPIDSRRTIWSVLRDLLLPFVDHIHVVMSPAGRELFESVVSREPERSRISVSVQTEPRGMGDAIFGARPFWLAYNQLLVVWGDQVNLSAETIRRLTEFPADRSIVLPLVRQDIPYVQYDFDGAQLVRVRQTREGDRTDAGGFSDVGLFGLPVEQLCSDWDAFSRQVTTGAATGEINFLPFLPYLCCERARPVEIVTVEDADEARGVNTPDDLAFVRARLR